MVTTKWNFLILAHAYIIPCTTIIQCHVGVCYVGFQRYPEDVETLEETRKHNEEIMKALEKAAKDKDPFWVKKK